ncbi:MAG: hypothetical protein ATN31_09085 [Candidatus Epulonipiscioides saccharophilum]|nr:MAG: hypothetical protein ATN31_09085 [Epulopiscium sp. AS2M-Bin001]
MDNIFDKLSKTWDINSDKNTYKQEISHLIHQLYIQDDFEDLIILSQRILDLSFKFSVCKIRYADALIGSELVLKEITELHGISKIFVCNQDFVHPDNLASYNDSILTLSLWCEIIRYNENNSLEPIELLHNGQRFEIQNRLIEAYQIIEIWELTGDRWYRFIQIAKSILQQYDKQKSLFEYICDLFGHLCNIFIFYIDIDMPIYLERFVKLVVQENKLTTIQIPDIINAQPQNIILFDLALDILEQWCILKYPSIIERSKLNLLVKNRVLEDGCIDETNIIKILHKWNDLEDIEFNFKILINDLTMLLLDKDDSLKMGWDTFNLTKHLISNMMTYNEIKNRWFIELESYEHFLELVSIHFNLQLNLAKTFINNFANYEIRHL